MELFGTILDSILIVESSIIMIAFLLLVIIALISDINDSIKK